MVEQNGFQIRNQHKILVYMSWLGPKLQNKSSLQLLHLCHQESEKVGVAESEILPRKAKNASFCLEMHKSTIKSHANIHNNST